jgi:hypothetical protein
MLAKMLDKTLAGDVERLRNLVETDARVDFAPRPRR